MKKKQESEGFWLGKELEKLKPILE